MKKILIFGLNGQLASEFKKITIGQKNIYQVGQDQASFLNPDQIVSLISEVKPTYIINAAAYTAVDKAESDQSSAMQINGNILGIIGESAKKINSSVTHFSTDYVFDGQSSKPYIETDQINPVNYYGLTKSVGDKNLIDSGCNYQIFRVSWVYGRYGHNFLKTMLRLGSEKKELKIVSDQFGVPTLSSDIAQSVWQILKDPSLSEKNGLYHMAPSGQTNWFEFANCIFKLAQKTDLNYRQAGSEQFDFKKNKIITESVLPISSDQFLSAAKRPRYSLLSSDKLKDTFDVHLPDWQTSLESVFKVI